jgi:plastocyanin
MKTLAICALVMVSILIISGCGGLPVAEEQEEAQEEEAPAELSEEAQSTKELIEQLSKEEGLIEGDEEDEETDEEDSATKDLIEQLSKEAGLTDDDGEETDEDDEEEEEEITGPEEYTIVIDIFTGDPEDLTVTEGSSITWINNHPNFIHLIGIRPEFESGTHGDSITDKNRIYQNETFTYTFDEEGLFQWYSETKYPESSGLITVEALPEETGDNTEE